MSLRLARGASPTNWGILAAAMPKLQLIIPRDRKGGSAFETFAASKDLVNWTKWTGPKLVESLESWYRTHAHKPWVIKHDGVVYHFYCAVGDRGRALALATSADLKDSCR